MRESTMTYFIVETPYEKCFELFFKNELGYPNFYRLTEFFPDESNYEDLTLIAPTIHQDPLCLEKIEQKALKSQIRYHPFGDNLETSFSFDEGGKLNTLPIFEEALRRAVLNFLSVSEPKKRHSI
jgi:hypothetical protein